MFIGALWVLEQEQNAFDYLWGKAGLSMDKHPLDTRGGSTIVGLGMAGAIAQTGFIASQPYAHMIRWVGHEEDFLRKLAKHTPRSAGGKGVPIGFSLRPFGPKWMKASAGRKLAAKVGARFIPYAGWALLAVDMWHVGKWIGDKTNPFTVAGGVFSDRSVTGTTGRAVSLNGGLFPLGLIRLELAGASVGEVAPLFRIHMTRGEYKGVAALKCGDFS